MAGKDNPVFSSSLGNRTERQEATSKLSYLRNQEATKSVLSKLTEGLFPKPVDRDGNRKTTGPSQQLANRVVMDSGRRITDARNMLRALPDLEMVKQIVIASILSPQDLIKTELNFTLATDALGDLGGEMLSVIAEYFKGVYKIDSKLEEQLDAALFMEGSFPIAVLPESSIDYAINHGDTIGLESLGGDFDRSGKIIPIGLLGPARVEGQKVGLESVFAAVGYNHEGAGDNKISGSEGFVTVTDNPMILRAPRIAESVSNSKIRAKYEAASINAKPNQQGRLSDAMLEQLFKRRQYAEPSPILALKTPDQLSRGTIGHPLVMHLPAECVIPVHVPGDPRDHIGYYVMLDVMGNPLTIAANQGFLDSLNMSAMTNQEMQSALLKQAAIASHGIDVTDDVRIREMEYNYMRTVEDDLLSRLRNGAYGDNVTVSKPTEVFRIMFARSCARQHTQLLFLPASLMTYIAFDYNDYGVGTSLFDATKDIGTQRALLSVANTLSQLKNSTNHVNLDITLDPDDPDPAQRVEQFYHEYVKTRQFGFPERINKMADLADFIQSGGVSVTASGNTGYPETKMVVESVSSQRQEVNTDLMDHYKRQQYLGLGVTPEMVDRSMSEELATSLIQQNLLLAKRVKIYGEEFCGFQTEFVQNYTLTSSKLLDKLREIVQTTLANGDKTQSILKIIQDKETANLSGSGATRASEEDVEKLISFFVKQIKCTLPSPDTTSIAVQKDELTAYGEFLDAVLPAFVNSDMFDSNAAGELSSSVGMTVAILKAKLMREWMRQKNVAPEVFELFMGKVGDEPGYKLLDDHAKYMEDVMGALEEFMKKVLPAAKSRDATIQAANGGEELEEGSTVSSTTDSGSSDDTGGDDGGMDDLSFDFGGDDTGADADAEPADDAAVTEKSETSETSSSTTGADGSTTETSSNSTSSETEV